MPVERYRVWLQDTNKREQYSVLVSTTSESSAIKIAKKKLMEQKHIARENIVCYDVDKGE